MNWRYLSVAIVAEVIVAEVIVAEVIATSALKASGASVASFCQCWWWDMRLHSPGCR